MKKKELQEHARQQADEINKRGVKIEQMQKEMDYFEKHLNDYINDSNEVKTCIRLRLDMLQGDEFDEERRFLEALIERV